MIDPADALKAIPQTLRQPLIDCFREIVQNYVERRWEPSELNGGKFCEVVYSILFGALSGSYPSKPSKPSRMVDACRALEGLPADPTRVGDRSLRILIPRLLPYLYEIRNNRGVGHVGGDVDPNHMDATCVMQNTAWVMGELVRVFHGITTAQAQLTVDALVERRHPLVWQVDGTKRVLDSALSKADQTLILLYSESGWIEDKTLFNWVEYGALGTFRTRILVPLHDDRIIEYDKGRRLVRLSPKGSLDVEKRLLQSAA